MMSATEMRAISLQDEADAAERDGDVGAWCDAIAHMSVVCDWEHYPPASIPLTPEFYCNLWWHVQPMLCLVLYVEGTPILIHPELVIP